MEIKNKSYPLPNIIFIILLSLVCIFYFIYFQNLIPAKFTFDSTTIMSGIQNPLSVDPSYRRVSGLFKILGVTSTSSTIYLHLVAWLIFQLFLIEVLRINKDKLFSITQIIFLLFIVSIYGVYFNTLSKDLVLIFLLLICLNFYMINDNFRYLIAFIGIYALYFRSYWIILLIFSLYIYVIKKPRLKRMMIDIIIIFIITIIIYDLFNGDFMTNNRANINQQRIMINDPNVKSMIMNIFPNNNIINDIINYLYVLITLFIPIQGIKSSNVIIYYIWIIGICALIIKFKKQLNMKLLLLLFSYINMQALFEPDMGSAFRHQMALFPLIYYLLNSIKIKENKS